MKKLFKSALMFAAAAMAFTGCSDDDTMNELPSDGSAENRYTLNVTANIESQTRAEFEGGNNGQMKWIDGDRIRVAYKSAGGYDYFVNMAYDAAGNKFNQEGQMSRPIGEGTQVNAWTLTPGKNDDFKGVPANQENTFDAAGNYFNIKNTAFEAEPVTFDPSMGDGKTMNLTFSFKHIASYMQLRFVTEKPELVGKKIKSVKYSAGGVSTEGDFVQVDFTDNCPIVVDKAAQKDLNNVAYLAVLPGTYAGEFMVETMDGDFFTIPASTTFTRAKVHRVALNLKPAQGETMFIRLTSDNINNLLVDGAEFVILGASNASKNYVSNGLKSYEKNIDQVIVKDFSSGITTDVVTPEEISNADVRVFKLEKSTSNAWLIRSADGRYLSMSKGSFKPLVLEELKKESDIRMFQYEITIIPSTDKTDVRCLGPNKALRMRDNFLKTTNPGGTNVNTSIFVKTVK